MGGFSHLTTVSALASRASAEETSSASGTGDFPLPYVFGTSSFEITAYKSSYVAAGGWSMKRIVLEAEGTTDATVTSSDAEYVDGFETRGTTIDEWTRGTEEVTHSSTSRSYAYTEYLGSGATTQAGASGSSSETVGGANPTPTYHDTSTVSGSWTHKTTTTQTRTLFQGITTALSAGSLTTTKGASEIRTTTTSASYSYTRIDPGVTTNSPRPTASVFSDLPSTVSSLVTEWRATDNDEYVSYAVGSLAGGAFTDLSSDAETQWISSEAVDTDMHGYTGLGADMSTVTGVSSVAVVYTSDSTYTRDWLRATYSRTFGTTTYSWDGSQYVFVPTVTTSSNRLMVSTRSTDELSQWITTETTHVYNAAKSRVAYEAWVPTITKSTAIPVFGVGVVSGVVYCKAPPALIIHLHSVDGYTNTYSDSLYGFTANHTFTKPALSHAKPINTDADVTTQYYSGNWKLPGAFGSSDDFYESLQLGGNSISYTKNAKAHRSAGGVLAFWSSAAADYSWDRATPDVVTSLNGGGSTAYTLGGTTVDPAIFGIRRGVIQQAGSHTVLAAKSRVFGGGMASTDVNLITGYAGRVVFSDAAGGTTESTYENSEIWQTFRGDVVALVENRADYIKTSEAVGVTNRPMNY